MTRERRRHSALRLPGFSVHLSIPVKCCGTWLTQFFPLKLTNGLQLNNADHYRQSDIVFDFKTAHMSLIGSIALQSSLSAGKQKLTVILVKRRSMQVAKELGACANSVYQGSGWGLNQLFEMWNGLLWFLVQFPPELDHKDNQWYLCYVTK